MRYLISLVILPACFCIPITCSIVKQKIFIIEDDSNPENKTLVTITWDKNKVTTCEMFTGKKFHEEMQKIPNDYVFQKPTAENMKIVLNDCTVFSTQSHGNATEDNENNFIQKVLNSDFTNFTHRLWPFTGKKSEVESVGLFHLIYPGTKWCGAGDIAENYDDLGVHRDTDMCCREHDHCDDGLLPGQSRHNLTNDFIFTKLHCKCDDALRNCLRKVNSHVSNTIGNVYFNVLKTDCYTLAYPKKKECKKFKKTLSYGFVKVCEEYEEDTEAEKVYQWVRVAPFEPMDPVTTN